MTLQKRSYRPTEELDGFERTKMVREIFAAITGKYDFLNRLLSLRRDLSWRRFTVERMRFPGNRRLLDMAAGTCDLAIEAALRYPRVTVTGVDFVREMLDLGARKIRQKGLATRIGLLQGDALNIPLADAGFDVAAMAFGIRNIPDRIKAISELRRVTAPGGQVLVLELTLPQGRFFRRLYHIYLTVLIPLLARVFSPDPNAYRYLGESIMNFPTVEEFQGMMSEAGLVEVRAWPLTFGICHLFEGFSPQSLSGP